MQITEDGTLSSSLEVLHHEDTEDRIIYSAAFHPSGPFVAVSQGNECYFYLIHVDDSKKKISRLENLCHFQTDFKDADSVQNICEFSPDGQWLATAGEEGVIRLWQVSGLDNQCLKATKKHDIVFEESINSLAFSADSHNVRRVSQTIYIDTYLRCHQLVYTSKGSCHVFEIENQKRLQAVSPLPQPAGSSFRGCTFVRDTASDFIVGQGKPRFRSLLSKWSTSSGKSSEQLRPSLDGPQTALSSLYNPTTKEQILLTALGVSGTETRKRVLLTWMKGRRFGGLLRLKVWQYLPSV